MTYYYCLIREIWRTRGAIIYLLKQWYRNKQTVARLQTHIYKHGAEI